MVFGALRYLPWAEGAGAWLRSIELDGQIGTIRFWELEEGTEPDVIIDTPEHLVVIEAKVDAGFGDRQLGREYLWLLRRSSGRTAVLVTVTREPLSVERLRQQVLEDLVELGADVPPPSLEVLRSLTWASVGRWWRTRTDHRSVADDVLAYLRFAGLAVEPFNGWRGGPIEALPEASFFRWRPFLIAAPEFGPDPSFLSWRPFAGSTPELSSDGSFFLGYGGALDYGDAMWMPFAALGSFPRVAGGFLRDTDQPHRLELD